MNRMITSVGVALMLAMGASMAQAQVGANFDPADWVYGPRGVAEGDVPIWNPVMQKIKNGEPVIGARSAPRIPGPTAPWPGPGTTSSGSRCSTKP